MLIVELTLQSPIFAETFERHPDVELAVDSQNILDDGAIQMLVWATNVDADAFETALDADRSIATHQCLTSATGRRLYRVRFSDWSTEYSVHARWVELGASLLDSTGRADGWSIRMRFPDRESVGEFYRACEERDVPVEVTALYHSVESDAPGYGVTEKQREALAAAYDGGYFTVPREANLTELAATMGISRQSFSRRLTRGLRSLLENTVVDRTDVDG